MTDKIQYAPYNVFLCGCDLVMAKAILLFEYGKLDREKKLIHHQVINRLDSCFHVKSQRN